ncbi:metallophosphoesterase [Lactobacillus paragasseri]|uniref:metallophosphoesterase n=1 Tax=Lactobacillus paragasseri TaxID=2107999 RepID=UPI0012E308D5|nr:metallophosphoesterase [Lactobacillus paragasseri]MDK8085726.1 metallophosphoesterase [Lactobacillus paragasseri]MDX5117668.1 metallophosphoesterase [Lactobacillus paragasseri]MDX5121548.1 metallophosphoesterase [Lactobacillus paragasseri]QGT97701.1 metallophosphoesterase [Lactobacillus paragasseri]UWI46916.1 metallophosphoesterase [Lactobacillus paragasseri]
MLTQDKKTSFWVISDTHLIADSLHDDGQAFSQMQKTSQGKDLYYQETTLSAFVRMAEEKKPAAIIVTGDVTFNGERVSAERFAEIFKPLTKTKLLVLPGNHDIYDGWAREFHGKKQYYAGQISPRMWRNIFRTSYETAVSVDNSSLAYSVQLNPDYLLILADSNDYGKEESSTAPATAGFLGKEQRKWIKEQLQYASQNNLRVIFCMHHNLYAHNPAVNKGYVVDDYRELRKLLAQYNVKLVFSGHIHAQNIMSPQNSCPATEVVTASFCSNDQGYGVVKVSPKEISYTCHHFKMKDYLTDKEKQNWTLTHFHDYLENIQLGTISAELMQKDLYRNHDDLKSVRQMGRLFGEMNYHFFIGKNHIDFDELQKLKKSEIYQRLISENPQYELYLQTLYDTSVHDNLHVKIKY